MTRLERILKTDWPLNLIMTVLEYDEEKDLSGKLPEDYEGSVEYVLHSFLQRHEMDMVRMRYQKKRSLAEIALKHDMTEEHVRLQIEKGIRKLKDPYIRGFLQFGVAAEICRKVELRKKIIESDAYWRGRIDEAKETAEKQMDVTQEKLPALVADLGLSMRAHSCLNKAGIRHVDVLLLTPYNDLLSIRNLGKKTADEIVNLLNSKGYSLPEYPRK